MMLASSHCCNIVSAWALLISRGSGAKVRPRVAFKVCLLFSLPLYSQPPFPPPLLSSVILLKVGAWAQFLMHCMCYLVVWMKVTREQYFKKVVKKFLGRPIKASGCPLQASLFRAPFDDAAWWRVFEVPRGLVARWWCFAERLPALSVVFVPVY